MTSAHSRTTGLRHEPHRPPRRAAQHGAPLSAVAARVRHAPGRRRHLLPLRHEQVESFDTAIALFRDEYRLPLLPPEIAAYMGTTVELTAPVLLVLGLFARLGAAALLVMTLTIQFLVYPENWPEHLMWASILAYVLSRGPGALSIDRIVAFNLFGRA